MVEMIAYSNNGEIYYAPSNEPQKFPRATEEEIKKHEYNANIDFLRSIREKECFSVINRGQLWYASLTYEQVAELDVWYKEWLDITDNYEAGAGIKKIIPVKPKWLN